MSTSPTEIDEPMGQIPSVWATNVNTSPELDKLIKQQRKLLDLAEPYMKHGVGEDWQEFIAEVQRLNIAAQAYTAQAVQQARIDELYETINHGERHMKGDDSSLNSIIVMDNYIDDRLATLSTQPQEEDQK